MNQKHRLRLELKRVGHKHILKLMDLGYPRARIYFILKNKFGRINGNGRREFHFASTNDYAELERVVKYLALMVRMREGAIARRKARTARWKETPWYSKLRRVAGWRYYFRRLRWKLSTMLHEDLTKT